jgi:hypothetical protein
MEIQVRKPRQLRSSKSRALLAGRATILWASADSCRDAGMPPDRPVTLDQSVIDYDKYKKH